jgi:hypothetical protein
MFPIAEWIVVLTLSIDYFCNSKIIFRQANKRKGEDLAFAQHFEEKKLKTTETSMDAINSSNRLKQEQSHVEIKPPSFTPSGEHFFLQNMYLLTKCCILNSYNNISIT